VVSIMNKIKCLVGSHEYDYSIIKLDLDRDLFFVECKHCKHRKWLNDSSPFLKRWREILSPKLRGNPV
jgi:hypothetical protein